MSILLSIVAIIITIMSLNNERIRFTVKLGLSAITAYALYCYKYPKTTIINCKEYDLPIIKNWINEGYCFNSILLTSLVYFSIYVILKNVIKYLFLDKLIRRIVLSKIRGQENYYLSFFIKGAEYTVNNFYPKNKLKNIKSKLKKEADSDEVSDILYSALLLSLHVCICWYILGIYNHISVYILFLLMVLIILFAIISIYIVRPYFNYIIENIKIK